MKVTDLKIGDHVLFQGHTCIVEEISLKGWVHLLYADTKTRVNLTSDYVIDELQPIHSVEFEQQQEPTSHWQAVREMAAITALQGFISSPKFDRFSKTFIAEEAVKCADALVEKLKENKL